MEAVPTADIARAEKRRSRCRSRSATGLIYLHMDSEPARDAVRAPQDGKPLDRNPFKDCAGGKPCRWRWTATPSSAGSWRTRRSRPSCCPTSPRHPARSSRRRSMGLEAAARAAGRGGLSQRVRRDAASPKTATSTTRRPATGDRRYAHAARHRHQAGGDASKCSSRRRQAGVQLLPGRLGAETGETSSRCAR